MKQHLAHDCGKLITDRQQVATMSHFKQESCLVSPVFSLHASYEPVQYSLCCPCVSTEQILDDRQASLEETSTLEDEEYSENEDHVPFYLKYNSEFDERTRETLSLSIQRQPQSQFTCSLQGTNMDVEKQGNWMVVLPKERGTPMNVILELDPTWIAVQDILMFCTFHSREQPENHVSCVKWSKYKCSPHKVCPSWLILTIQVFEIACN